MKIRLVLLSLIAVFATGCIRGGKDGIWLIFIDPFTDFTCDTTIVENFTTGDPPTDPGGPTSEWTYTETETETPAALFALVVVNKKTAEDDTLTLIIEGDVYPGQNDGGTHVFDWVGSTVVSDEEKHATGFRWKTMDTEEVTQRIEMDFSGKRAEGKLATNFRQIEAGEESDRWDPAQVGRNNGDLPFAITYLEDAQGNPVNDNDPDVADCSEADCKVTVTTTCNTETTITAVKTDLKDEAYDEVRNAGQDFGAGG